MWERVEKRGIERRGLVAGPGDRPRPDLPAGTDLLPAIKQIVVLMMENHSYDNYLGMLADRGDGLPVDASGTPTAVNILPNGQRVAAWHLPTTAQVTGNPTQTWHASHLSADGVTCGGFATSVWQTVPGADPAIPMGYWTGADLPFYHGLARAFPVADRWFCSCLGPTFPNRRFLISGTANGLIDAADVVDACVVRQAKAYPVYDDSYRDNVAMIRLDLETSYPTLHLVGRNGMHKYNNQDHAMMTAMLTARNILAGERVYDIWDVNEDAEYHEAGASGVREALRSERLVPERVKQVANG